MDFSMRCLQFAINHSIKTDGFRGKKKINVYDYAADDDDDSSWLECVCMDGYQKQ